MQARLPPERISIGAVVDELRKSYADVSRSSLRFLEREGLVVPDRTAGGHRLYAPADIDRIRQVKAWQAERLSLDEIRQRLAARADLPAPAVLTRQFLAAALRGDAAASRLVLHADEVGMPLAEVFQDVLTPALIEVGDRWQRGELRVGQEHEISEVAREVIAELTVRHADPNPVGPPILAACVAGERHELGLRMLVGLLREAGCVVHFLGADVAPAFLREEVATHRPAVVLLSATMVERLPAVRTAIEAVRAAAAPASPRIFVGGQGTGAHRSILQRSGVELASDDQLKAAVRAIRAIATGAELSGAPDG